MPRHTLINLHLKELWFKNYVPRIIPGLCYYPYLVNLDRCVGSCNTPNDLSNRVYIPNKTEDLNRNAFSTFTGRIDFNKIYIMQM